MTQKFKLIICAFLMQVIIVHQAKAQERTNNESYYKIKQIYLPEEKRPAVEYDIKKLPFKNVGGELPTYDGEQFQINAGGLNLRTADDAKGTLNSFLQSLNVKLQMDKDLRLNLNKTTSKADSKYISEQIALGKQSTKDRIKRDLKDVSKSSENMLDEMDAELQKQSAVSITVYRFDQFFNDMIIDNTAISLTGRSENEIYSIHGRFYNTVNPTNKKVLNLKDAIAKSIPMLQKENKFDNIKGSEKGDMVLLPYADGFKFAWRTEITADGPYQIWIDAETGAVLQLLPEFYFSNAKGLVFNPSPTAGTTEMAFDVDPPSGGHYTLKLTGALTLINGGTDGTTGLVQVNDDGTGTANFNAAPINGTAVERTNVANYNGQFQQVNAYAHIFNERKMYMLLGSETFPAFSITVNDNDACGFGIDNACSSVEFGLGSATNSTSTSCGAVFNSANDATVVAHEFGHRLNGLQYGVGGGTLTGAMNEGMADFWACTNFNTDIFGGWWGHNCPAPVQSGFTPRQAEATDIFPDRNSTGGSNEIHSAGQNIAWAMFSSRQGMNDASGFGTLSINLNAIKAMTTAGIGISNTNTDKGIHDAYQDLLKQLLPLYQTSRLANKLLAGFARAGIFISPKDAIIDIDHSYLNRASATGPVFTVWTGNDYTFSGTTVVTSGTLPFNTQVMIEVANDAAFTSNLKSSGWINGVVSAAGGTRTWTLPTPDWNVLKAGTDIYYRVTTKDAAGSNIRNSWQPGNNFCGVNVPVGRAAINGTGTKDCSCSASASVSGATSDTSLTNSWLALLPVLPIGVLFYFRRKNAKKNKS